jgi:rubrerythrin
MISGKEDLLQSLVEAFLMEKGTKVFYDQASEKSASSEAKRIFSELAVWEGRHMEYLQYLYRSILGDVELKSFEDFKKKEKVPLTEGGIPVKDLEAKIEKHTVSDEKGALTLAMDIEGKAYNLYRRLSQKAEDANARVVFSEMMKQEVKHIDHLKKLRLKLVKAYE